MNCNDAASLIAAYADGETGRRQTRAIGNHLLGCRECAASTRICWRCARGFARKSPRYSAPPGLRARVLATLEAGHGGACTQALFDRWRAAGRGAATVARRLAFAWNPRSWTLARRRRAGRLRGHRARMGRRHGADRLARERRHRGRGGDVARAGDARPPPDPGRIVEPAHGEAVAFGAARLFAAGARLRERRLRAGRRPRRYVDRHPVATLVYSRSATTRSTCS